MAKKHIAAKTKKKAGVEKPATTWYTRPPVVYLLFCLLIFLIYGKVLGSYLGKFDEDILILGNLTMLKNLSNIPLAFTNDVFFSANHVSFYRPVQTLSYMIDAQFFFGRGSVFYFTNMLLHAAACSTLFYLLTLMGKDRKAALVFTLLFLATPLFVHAIAWAPSRGDLLIGLCGLLTLTFFIKLLDTRSYKYGVLMLAAFFVAMFSKETAIVIPLLIALYYLMVRKEQKLPLPFLVFFASGLLLIMASYLLVRSQVIRTPLSAGGVGGAALLHNLPVLPEYVAKFFIPVALAPMPAFTMVNTLTGLLLLAGLAGGYLWFSPKPGFRVLYGFVWFLLFALPGLMYSHTLGSAAYDYLEHRAYLPMAGIIMALFFIYSDIPAGNVKNRVVLSVATLACILGVYSFVYAGNYENPMVFYNHTVAANPASALALNNRGLIRAENRDFRGAVGDYDLAITVKHDYAQAFVNKGIALAALGDRPGAVVQYKAAIAIDPVLFQAHFNLANVQYESGGYADAVRGYTTALALNPGYLPGFVARASSYVKMNHYAEAELDFTRALQLDGGNATVLLNRGKVRYLGNNKKGACDDWAAAAGLGNADAGKLLSDYCK